MIKECFIQSRLAHRLVKDKRYRFTNFLSALDYVRTNWAGLKGQVTIGLLWKPKGLRKPRFHKIVKRRNLI